MDRVRGEWDQRAYSYEFSWKKVKTTHDKQRFTKGKIFSSTTIDESTTENYGSSAMEQLLGRKEIHNECNVEIHRGMMIPQASELPMPDDLRKKFPGAKLVYQDNEVRMLMTDQVGSYIQNRILTEKGESTTSTLTCDFQKWTGWFRVTSQLRGNIVITVYRNGEFERSLTGDMCTIFTWAKEKSPRKFKNIRIRDCYVEYDTEGEMEFEYIVKRSTNINSHKLHEESCICTIM